MKSFSFVMLQMRSDRQSSLLDETSIVISAGAQVENATLLWVCLLTHKMTMARISDLTLLNSCHSLYISPTVIFRSILER